MRYGDMPIGALKAVRFTDNGSSYFLDQSIREVFSIISSILLSSLFDTSTWPLV